MALSKKTQNLVSKAFNSTTADVLRELSKKNPNLTAMREKYGVQRVAAILAHNTMGTYNFVLGNSPDCCSSW